MLLKKMSYRTKLLSNLKLTINNQQLQFCKIRHTTQKHQFQFFRSKYVAASVVNLCNFLLILTKILICSIYVQAYVFVLSLLIVFSYITKT